jgi:hypothetical protein
MQPPPPPIQTFAPLAAPTLGPAASSSSAAASKVRGPPVPLRRGRSAEGSERTSSMRATGGHVGWREGRRMVEEEDVAGGKEQLLPKLGDSDGGGGRNTGGNTEWNKLNLASLHAAVDERDRGGGGGGRGGGEVGGKGSSAPAGGGGGGGSAGGGKSSSVSRGGGGGGSDGKGRGVRFAEKLSHEQRL